MTTKEQLSETEVIDRVVAGDLPAFEILIRKYNPYLYKIGRAYRFSHEDVEDLMQDAFISAFQGLPRLQNRAHFKTWLVRIMLNECYHKSQKAAARRMAAAETLFHNKDMLMYSDKSPGDAERTISSRELGKVIENAIQQIPVGYRMVFALRELNGMSVAETANVLQLTETNVKVRLNRAKVLLRKEVEKTYTTEDIFQFNLIYCDRLVHKVMEKLSRLHQQ